MKLLVISNKRYQTDFRKYLIRAATQAGNQAAHLYCWSDIRLTCHDTESEPYPFNSTHTPLTQIQDLFGNGAETIVLTGMNGYASKFAKSLKKHLPDAHFIFDVFDDFRYGARGREALKWLKQDLLWRCHCHGTIVLDSGLSWRYPYAYHLDNASHVQPLAATDTKVKTGLVYIGSIDGRTDFDFIRQILERGLALDMYGAIHCSRPEAEGVIQQLCQQFNQLRYHGSYDNDQLPQILAPYAIGIVPYRSNSPLTKHINPDKIYHYLSAGLEVIATPIPQVVKMQKFLHLTAQPLDIQQLIHNAQNQPKVGKWSATENSWAHRWQQLQTYASGLKKIPRT